jgi:hypothetical protein
MTREILKADPAGLDGNHNLKHETLQESAVFQKAIAKGELDDSLPTKGSKHID